MKIVFDARWIFRKLSGVPIYTQELIRQFVHLGTDHEFVLLFDDPDLCERTREETGFDRAPNFRVHMVPYSVFSPRGQVQLPGLLKSLGADVYHTPNYMMPLLAFPRNREGRVRCVVTIHDLIPMVLRDHAPRSKKSRLYPLYRRIMLEVGARADRILTVSEASRKDVLEHLDIRDPDKVVTVYNGVSPVFTPGDEARTDANTILYVGRFDPYKNAVLLIEAVAKLRAAGRESLKLHLLGPKDPRYPEAEQEIELLSLSDAVQWDEQVSDQVLLDAYRSAAVLVLPTRIEGFGLPVAEAMACGTPVVCSNRSSLPEVAGDAALMFDPDKPETLVSALEKVLDDKALAQKLRAAGPAQAAKFSWEKAARETLEVYGT